MTNLDRLKRARERWAEGRAPVRSVDVHKFLRSRGWKPWARHCWLNERVRSYNLKTPDAFNAQQEADTAELLAAVDEILKGE